MKQPLGYDGVAVVCPVTVPYERRSDRPAAWFAGRALSELLRAAGIAKGDIDGLAMASFTMGRDTTIAMTEHLGMVPRWIEWLPTGGASGVMALRRAARAVQCGDAEIVACIAADTALPEDFHELVRDFGSFSSEAVYPHGSGGPNVPFALITDYYMDTFGATREDFGHIVIEQRRSAARNPNALLKDKPLDLARYLAAAPIVEPLHLNDCVMPCAGAEAFLVMSRDKAASLGLASCRILGAIERHNAYHDEPVAVRGGWAMDRDQLYAQAGIDPEAIDCLQVYDDYPVICAMQVEDLGFCGKGEGARFLRQQSLGADGDFPLNTSGGQLGCGQAGAAGGFLPVVEALRQLLGQPLGGQVPGARRAMASGYGMVTFDRCLASGAAILEAAS